MPGSKEALEADRKKDAERQRKNRAETRPDPPPIPAHTGPGPAPGGDLGVVTPGEPGAAIPWTAAQLAPLIEQLVPAAEELMVKQVVDRCEAAHFPPTIIREIERDARWNAVAKEGLIQSAPAVAAKLMNKTGISSEYQDVAVLVGSVATIGMGHVQILNRLDQLIRQNQPAPPPTKPKPHPMDAPPGNAPVDLQKSNA